MEIQKADLRARRRALIVLFLATLVAAAMVFAFEGVRPQIDAWLSAHQDYLIDNLWLVWLTLLLLALPVVGGAIWLWFLGARIMAAERFPPPGVAVIRDTRIETGRAAVRRGRVFEVLAVLLATSAFVIPTLVWWLLTRLLRGG